MANLRHEIFPTFPQTDVKSRRSSQDNHKLESKNIWRGIKKIEKVLYEYWRTNIGRGYGSVVRQTTWWSFCTELILDRTGINNCMLRVKQPAWQLQILYLMTYLQSFSPNILVSVRTGFSDLESMHTTKQDVGQVCWIWHNLTTLYILNTVTHIYQKTRSCS